MDRQKFENQNDIVLVFTYISPERSSFYTNPTDNGIELLADKLVSISAEYPNADLFLAGDFNARTKTHKDFIVDDDTDYVFGENTAYPADTFSMPRNNRDCDFSNAYGFSLIELCSTFNIHMLNGRLFNDNDGNFTCFANNGTSVVDYMIASTTLFPKFTNFGIDNFDISDHMPIYCTLTLNVEPHMLTDNTYRQAQGNESNAYEKYRWKQEHKDVFLNKFRENFQNFQQHFRNHEISTVDLLPDFIRLFQNSAENMKCRQNNKTKVNQPEWWDRDCERAKKEEYFISEAFQTKQLSEITCRVSY